MIAVAACGGPSYAPLTGTVALQVNWLGRWDFYQRAEAKEMIEGLAASGYLARMPAPVAFGVVTDGGTVDVDIWAPSPEPSAWKGYPAWHEYTPGRARVVVMPTRALDATLFALTHELVETAADPQLYDQRYEIADACEGAKAAQMQIAGVLRLVPRYSTPQGCWPDGP